MVSLLQNLITIWHDYYIASQLHDTTLSVDTEKNMDFITQFEQTLQHTIEQGLTQEAGQLLAGFAQTRQPYTMRIYALINRLRQKNMPFRVPFTPGSPFRILLYKSDNYILNYIAGQFAAFFRSQGCETMFFDPLHFEESSKALFHFLEEGLDAAFFFNNVGLLQTFQDGTSLWETLGVPCFDFLVDHPMYYADSLDHALQHTTVLCADRTHCDYVTRFYNRVEHTLFLPAGGITTNQNPDFSWDSRPMDVLFIGSYKYSAYSPDDEPAKKLSAYLQAHTDVPFDCAAEKILEACCADFLSPQTLKDFIQSHRFTETNLTASYRREIIADLLDAGIHVDIYGEGWQQTGLAAHPNLHLHSPVSFEEGIRLMTQTKILLNHMAWFKDGSSERIFNAMAQGAVCVTDSSLYLDSFLQDGVNCGIFRLPDVASHGVSAKVKSILDSPARAAYIAKNAIRLSANHSWQAHLAELFLA